jgi:hypothetical protein
MSDMNFLDVCHVYENKNETVYGIKLKKLNHISSVLVLLFAINWIIYPTLVGWNNNNNNNFENNHIY